MSDLLRIVLIRCGGIRTARPCALKDTPVFPEWARLLARTRGSSGPSLKSEATVLGATKSAPIAKPVTVHLTAM